MMKAIAKYNFTIWIKGLHNISRQVAGKTCFLSRPEGLAFDDPANSLRRDGSIVLRETGDQLLRSAKFPTLSKIVFPEDLNQVRNFIRLIVRTNTSLLEACSITGVKTEDLTRFMPRLIYTR